MSKTESMLIPQSNILLKANIGQQQQQTLSFCRPKSMERISQNVTLPGFQLTSSPYCRSTGYSYENFNSASMNGVFSEIRGPFTQSQWMELEHQALIYKYIMANVPIPSNLLIPIRKALDFAGISSFSGGLIRPDRLCWGAFHLGLSGNTDPEPGRCRRTDGKKWRCSRDAVADQKYCERHMNRGRHRSRKHVEGQSGHSAAAASTTTAAKSTLNASSVSEPVVDIQGSSASNSLAVAQNHQQLKNLLLDSTSTLPAAATFSRIFLNKESLSERVQDSAKVSTLASDIDLRSKENPFLILEQTSYQESSQIEFGHVDSSSLINPSHDTSPLTSCRNFDSSEELTHQQSMSQHSINQFINDWPRSKSDQTDGFWPQVDVQRDGTKLSIAIPVTPTDFMSSPSSPSNEKDFTPVELEMEVGIFLNEFNKRQANWMPVPWETSMGDPLGEVLHNINYSGTECKSSSPIEVLQKTAFSPLSNSSTESCPRAENSSWLPCSA